MKTTTFKHVYHRRIGLAARGAQRGIVLVIALIVLVAMTLAGIALIRSVDSSTLIAGNLAFRQSATNSADRITETAIAWLAASTGTTLENNSAANGYYATGGNSDFTGIATPANPADDFNWGTSAKQVATNDAAGNQGAYVIHRLCTATGAVSATASAGTGGPCSVWATQSWAGGFSVGTREKNYLKGMVGAGSGGSGTSVRGLYRITVRVAGPRNTFSYVQTIVVI